MSTTSGAWRRTGREDRSGGAKCAVQSLRLGGLVSAVIFGVCFPLAPRLLGLMGAGPSIVHTGSTYTRVMLSGSGVILMLFLMNAIFRGAGHAAVAMRVLWLANAINIWFYSCLSSGLWPVPR